MKLWLDDVREPWRFGCLGWEWVKTAEEAIALLKTGNVEKASLDHDLTPEQTMAGALLGAIKEDGVKSGYDVVLWLEQNPQYWPPKGTIVHSMNPVGRDRMAKVIARHYKCSPMVVQRFLNVK
jgi:hypothetical protein